MACAWTWKNQGQPYAPYMSPFLSVLFDCLSLQILQIAMCCMCSPACFRKYPVCLFLAPFTCCMSLREAQSGMLMPVLRCGPCVMHCAGITPLTSSTSTATRWLALWVRLPANQKRCPVCHHLLVLASTDIRLQQLMLLTSMFPCTCSTDCACEAAALACALGEVCGTFE